MAGEPCILLGRMEDVAAVENSSHIPQKVKIDTWAAKLLLGLNLKELPVGTPTDTCTRIFIPAPFTTDEREMQRWAMDKQNVLHTQLPLRQHRFELHRSTYTCMFFSKYIL